MIYVIENNNDLTIMVTHFELSGAQKAIKQGIKILGLKLFAQNIIYQNY